MLNSTLINDIALYQNASGEIQIKFDSQNETIWITQAQIVHVFGIDQSVVSRHIKNIFKDQEIDQNSNMQKMHNSNSDKPAYLYSLDVVLAVGYRTNSATAIKFRQWANSILKGYIQKGYVLNKKLLEEKQNQILEIQQTLEFLVKSSKKLQTADPFLDVLQRFTNSLITLNQFDENRIEVKQGQTGVSLEVEELRKIIIATKKELISKNEATELFGQEQKGKFESSIGAIFQTFDGQDVYSSTEEKAANILYLIIKNHGFIDGNKRIGSIIFVYFLAKNNFLFKLNGEIKINDNTLVSLALLVAQSNPDDKEILIKLIMKLIQ